MEFGFWPGGKSHPEPLFYCVSYPEPPGFREADLSNVGGRYSSELKEFVLPYEAVRLAPSPDLAVLDFLQRCYEIGAKLGRWERDALDYVTCRNESRSFAQRCGRGV